MTVPTSQEQAVDQRLGEWLDAHVTEDGPWQVRRLTGGNSNESCLLRGRDTTYVLRRPPPHALSASAHNLAREHFVLQALAAGGVPAPAPVAMCEDSDVPLAPFLVMEHVPDAVSLTTDLPARYRQYENALLQTADEVVDALVKVHRLDWRRGGLADFGRPQGFLDRQVRRWYGQWERIARRPLLAMDDLAGWLEANQPVGAPAALMHGDFHLDNCLFSAVEPRLLAVIDWEMATIGDPLLDLGLLLAFWGRRPLARPAMPAIQAVSRLPAAPSREHLLARYEDAAGIRVDRIDFYQCLAFFKLAAIVEAAYSQYLAGQLRTEYAAALEHDVPALLAEASDIAGLRP